MNDQTIILIPARMGSERFPGKPLVDIAGEPMIVHVWKRAREAGFNRVVVATDAEEIAKAIKAAGGEAVMTAEHHQSGSDRIYEALEICDPDSEYQIIINLQGDMPTIDPAEIKAVLKPLENPETDIATLACEIRDENEISDPNVVKAIAPLEGMGSTAQALYFTRATAPYGEGPLYHHIGIYAYRRAALKRFVGLPPSMLEKREKLEQLRALEAGMNIGVSLVDTYPLGVDTPADLERAKRILGPVDN